MLPPGGLKLFVAPMRPMPTAQNFRITDALRCTLLNAPRSPNLACPRPALSGGRSPLPSAWLWRNVVLQPRNRIALADWRGSHLAGLVSARTRAGHRAWEIDGLYLPDDALAPDGRNAGAANGTAHSHGLGEPAADSLALLEHLVQEVGERYGERLFLRLASNSPALTLAKRVGFTAIFNEALLAGPGRTSSGDSPAQTPDSFIRERLRPRIPADSYGLFQLYCASVPVRARQALGLTFDQWQDAREPECGRVAPGQSQEWVADEAGRIIGWVRLDSRGSSSGAEVMAHPDHPDLLFRLVDFALARAPRLRWLVPDYREPVAERLRGRGYRQVAQYTLLARTVAVPALRYGMAPVEA